MRGPAAWYPQACLCLPEHSRHSWKWLPTLASTSPNKHAHLPRFDVLPIHLPGDPSPSCPPACLPTLNRSDHHSVYMFIWSYVPLASWLFENVAQPAGEALLRANAEVADFADDMWAWAKLQFGLLDSSGGCAGSGHEGGVLQRMQHALAGPGAHGPPSGTDACMVASSAAPGSGAGQPGDGSGAPHGSAAGAGARPYAAVHASPPGLGTLGASTAGALTSA